MIVNKTGFQVELDGFAFSNSWQYEGQEQQILETAVSGAVAVLAPVTTPIVFAVAGPVFAAEFAFLGPLAEPLIALEVAQLNEAVTGAIVNAIDAQGYGLCGGMAFSALDYYGLRWVLPRGNGPGDQPHRDHPQGTALRDYIWNRLLRSVQDNAGTFLEWMVVLNLGVGGGKTWIRDATLQQWNVLKGRINATGQPVPLGLIGTTLNPLNQHQVLATGYQDNGDGTGALYFYDNNAPGVECQDQLDFRGSQLMINEDPQSADSARGPLQAFFCTNYSPAMPPLAVVLSKPVTVTGTCARTGEAMEVACGVTNVGYHTTVMLSPEVVVSDGATVIQTPAQALTEGQAASLSQSITFSSPGERKLGAAVVLSNAGKTAVKLAPNPDGSVASTVGVNVVPPVAIGVVNQGECAQPAVAGGTTGFHVTNAYEFDGPLQFAWSVDAGAGGNPAAAVFDVQMPAATGAVVTVTCTVTTADGCTASGSLQVVTVSAQAAIFGELLCQLMHTAVYQRLLPFEWLPDPSPEGLIMPAAQIYAFQAGLTTLSEAAGALAATAADGEIVLHSFVSSGQVGG